jgi:hypothetical protein
VEDELGDVDQPVLPQGQLFFLPAGVLHDRDELPDDHGALSGGERAVTVPGQYRGAGRDGYQGEVQVAVGEEEAVGIEREGGGWQRMAVDAVLVVELDAAAARRRDIGQDVMVGQQQAGETRNPVP